VLQHVHKLARRATEKYVFHEQKLQLVEHISHARFSKRKVRMLFTLCSVHSSEQVMSWCTWHYKSGKCAKTCGNVWRSWCAQYTGSNTLISMHNIAFFPFHKLRYVLGRFGNIYLVWFTLM